MPVDLATPHLTKGGPDIALRPDSPKKAVLAILVAAFAGFGGILYGYDTGTISGILPQRAFKNQFGSLQSGDPSVPGNHEYGRYLTTSQTSLVVSILSAGTIFGALAGAPLADWIGRRLSIQVAVAIFTLGVALQTAAEALPLFVVGRVLAGLGVGLVSTLVPLYQSETAPRWIRGTVVSLYQFCVTLGLLLAAIVNNSTEGRQDSGAYRIPIAIQFVYALILSGGLIFLPESPRWLVKCGKVDEALHALARLHGRQIDDPVVQSELASIQDSHEDFLLSGGSGTYLDCFRRGEQRILFRTFTGISIQALSQLTGINFIFYYGTQFFGATGSGKNAYVFVIAANTVNVVSTLPCFYFIERYGRRALLIWGAAWMSVCELVVAALGTYYGLENTRAQSAIIAFAIIYVAGFAISWGPVGWAVCSEIYPLAIRAKALSLCIASNWLWNFGIGYATPYLVNSGPGNADLGSKVFWIWTFTCTSAGAFAYFTVMETKGLSLEEISLLYKESTPRKSKSFNESIKVRRNEDDDVRQDVATTELDKGKQGPQTTTINTTDFVQKDLA